MHGRTMTVLEEVKEIDEESDSKPSLSESKSPTIKCHIPPLNFPVFCP